jgi:hypothetical protein
MFELDCEQDQFDKGIWYYSNFAHVDHLDFCGLPPILSKLRILLGLEYRP